MHDMTWVFTVCQSNHEEATSIQRVNSKITLKNVNKCGTDANYDIFTTNKEFLKIIKTKFLTIPPP